MYVLSNNNSTDNTGESTLSFCQKSQIRIDYYEQKENIGLKKNALFVLAKASTEYVMYLGDDDFISEEYLKTIVIRLRKEKEISCVIPSYQCVLPGGELLPDGRDVGKRNKLYERGFIIDMRTPGGGIN